ncbi:MAG: hypothetical protein AABW56_05270 [Nanoarchaeota archaeon]
MANKSLNNGGWQANIKYFNNYVIKTPKTEKEIRAHITPHYQHDVARIEEKIRKLKNDWKNSIKIVKSGRVPLELFAFPEFLKGGKIKQRRVKMLSDEFEELISTNKLKEAKKLVDKVIDFILILWSYGVHEITFKFYSEMGLLDGNIVLVDIGELTDDKEVVVRQILKGHKKLEELRKYHHNEILNYYQEQIKKKLTIKKLNLIWSSKLT